MKNYVVLSLLSLLFFSCSYTAIPKGYFSGILMKDKRGRSYLPYAKNGKLFLVDQPITLGKPTNHKDNSFATCKMLTFGLPIDGNSLSGRFADSVFIIRKIRYGKKKIGLAYIVIRDPVYKNNYQIAMDSALKIGEVTMR
jgi:hypothetical protein